MASPSPTTAVVEARDKDKAKEKDKSKPKTQLTAGEGSSKPPSLNASSEAALAATDPSAPGGDGSTGARSRAGSTNARASDTAPVDPRLISAVEDSAARTLQSALREHLRHKNASSGLDERVWGAFSALVTSYGAAKTEELANVSIQSFVRKHLGQTPAAAKSPGESSPAESRSRTASASSTPRTPAATVASTPATLDASLVTWGIEAGQPGGLLGQLFSDELDEAELESFAATLFLTLPVIIPAPVALAEIFQEQITKAVDNHKRRNRLWDLFGIWLRTNIADFRSSIVLRESASSILDILPEKADELRSLLNESGVLGMDGPPTNSRDWPKPAISAVDDESLLLNADPKELARQLTVFEAALFARVTPYECLQYVWSGAKAERGSTVPNLLAWLVKFHETAAWVANEITTPMFTNKQVQLLVAFVQIAKHCLELGNYATMVAIIWAIDSPAVASHPLWAFVPAVIGRLLDGMRAVIDPNRDYAGYRSRLARGITTQTMIIPHPGVLLADVSRWKQRAVAAVGVGAAGGINLAHMRKLAEALQVVVCANKNVMKIRPLVSVQKFLLRRSFAAVPPASPIEDPMGPSTAGRGGLPAFFGIATDSQLEARVGCSLMVDGLPWEGTLYVTNYGLCFLARQLGVTLKHVIYKNDLSTLDATDGGLLQITTTFQEMFVLSDLPSAARTRLRIGALMEAEKDEPGAGAVKPKEKESSGKFLAEVAFEKIVGQSIVDGVPLKHVNGSHGIVVFSFEEMPLNTPFTVVGGFATLNRTAPTTVLINGAEYQIAPKMTGTPAASTLEVASSVAASGRAAMSVKLAHELRKQQMALEYEEEQRRLREERRNQRIDKNVEEAERLRQIKTTLLFERERQESRGHRRKLQSRSAGRRGRPPRGRYTGITARAIFAETAKTRHRDDDEDEDQEEELKVKASVLEKMKADAARQAAEALAAQRRGSSMAKTAGLTTGATSGLRTPRPSAATPEDKLRRQASTETRQKVAQEREKERVKSRHKEKPKEGEANGNPNAESSELSDQRQGGGAGAAPNVSGGKSKEKHKERDGKEKEKDKDRHKDKEKRKRKEGDVGAGVGTPPVPAAVVAPINGVSVGGTPARF